MLHNEGEARAHLATRVSRETMERLEAYAALLLKWQPRINLISPRDVPHIWLRHLADSYQLGEALSIPDFPVLDVGSGGGFPGLVIACCHTDRPVTLVESDSRKAAFLFEATRQLALPYTHVVNERIERLPPQPARAYTMRAFAPLDRILELLENVRTSDAELALLKGESIQDEILTAAKIWSFSYECTPSITHANGCMIRLKNITKR